MLQDFFVVVVQIYVFIYGCSGSLLLYVGFLQLQQVGCALQLRCAGFVMRWFLLLHSMGSRVHRFNSCGAWVQPSLGMWDLPGPGIKPMSPALAGRFFNTEPPGKPSFFFSVLSEVHNNKRQRVFNKHSNKWTSDWQETLSCTHHNFLCILKIHSIYRENHCCTAQEYLKRLNQSQAV